MKRRLTYEEKAKRFWDRVDKDGLGGCWLWTGTVNPKGYGRALHLTEYRPLSAHRVAWLDTYGSLPPAPMQLDHLCRVRRCVNPSHLEAVTPRENVWRGDTAARRLGSRSTCGRGHPFDGQNLGVRKDGGRRCRQCRAEDKRASRSRQ